MSVAGYYDGMSVRAEAPLRMEELEFVVFCVENVAVKLGVGAEEVYRAITDKSDILNGYIVPGYEVMHTQGKEYIVNDIIEVMQERGAII